ncbi:class I SAM-dependent methyltransferase [Nocardioides sp.]|uniref:class I SAM-dependent methyltransferase n=1 Tax=Nocardioides sp. TaxID=35761 RepID=UPI0035283EAE
MDAHAWDTRYADADLVWSAEPNLFVARECADLPVGTALDLAAGEGRNAIWLARQGWDVTAVDFSQVALDKGAQVAGDAPVRWVHADATSWQPDRAYDLVVLAYLQLAAEQRAAAVRVGFDALAPGGTFLVVAHDSTNLREGTGGPQDPAVLYTAQDVLADLDGRSYDVQVAERVERVVAGGGTHRHAGDAGAVAYDCLVRLTRR